MDCEVGLSKNKIEAPTDGIFADVMTILFQMHCSANANVTQEQIRQFCDPPSSHMKFATHQNPLQRPRTIQQQLHHHSQGSCKILVFVIKSGLFNNFINSFARNS